MAAKKNEQHPLRIEGYGSAGEGVARLEGRVVLSPGHPGGALDRPLEKVTKNVAWPGGWSCWRPPRSAGARLSPGGPVRRLPVPAHDLCRGTAL